MPFALQCDPGKDTDEKPWGSRFHHPFNDQVTNGRQSSHNGNQQGGPSRMQTNQGNIKLYEGDAMAPSYGAAHKDKGKGDTPGPGRPMQKRPQG
ncbi:hypothetical protein Tco_1275759 [Tanacetum coccineum]